MVSSSRMAWVGLQWIIGESFLAIMAVFGGLVIHTLVSLAMSIFVGTNITLVAIPLDAVSWIEPAYYAILLITGIALTWRCYQEIVAVTDYFPDTGVY